MLKIGYKALSRKQVGKILDYISSDFLLIICRRN